MLKKEIIKKDITLIVMNKEKIQEKVLSEELLRFIEVMENNNKMDLTKNNHQLVTKNNDIILFKY